MTTKQRRQLCHVEGKYILCYKQKALNTTDLLLAKNTSSQNNNYPLYTLSTSISSCSARKFRNCFISRRLATEQLDAPLPKIELHRVALHVHVLTVLIPTRKGSKCANCFMLKLDWLIDWLGLTSFLLLKLDLSSSHEMLTSNWDSLLSSIAF